MRQYRSSTTCHGCNSEVVHQNRHYTHLERRLFYVTGVTLLTLMLRCRLSGAETLHVTCSVQSGMLVQIKAIRILQVIQCRLE